MDSGAAPRAFTALEAELGAANGQPGERLVPARRIPVPRTVSPALQALIAAPYPVPPWNAAPSDAAGWRTLAAAVAAPALAELPAICQRLQVTMERSVLGGVPVFMVAPRVVPAANRDRLLIHVHGGAYVFFGGEAGAGEAVLMAAHGGFRVISIDYRMPPDAPYPAALDDAMAVWRHAIGMRPPGKLGLFGSSTGGALTLSMVLRAKQLGLPLPAAIAPGTPWADLTETGDSYRTNEWADNVLVSYGGVLRQAAALYAGGHSMADPLLSPIHGDFRGFPPAILTSGTRDLFLSNTVRTHRKLRQAGVEAVLQVFEGMSHAQYLYDPYAPETREAFSEIAGFFDRHLGR